MNGNKKKEKEEIEDDFSIPEDEGDYEVCEGERILPVKLTGFSDIRAAAIGRKYANEGSIMSMHWDTGIVVDDDKIQESVIVMYPSGETEMIPKDESHMEETLNQLAILADGLGGFGRVIDFGSGLKRPYCSDFNVVCHVDHRQRSGECDCGAKNKTLLDITAPEYDTLLCINSMQNNSSADQSKIFSDVKHTGKRLVIVQPKELNEDETDVRVEFILKFPIGLIAPFKYGMIFIHDPESEKGHQRLVAGKTEEMNISRYGILSTRKGQNLRSVVLMASDNRRPLVVLHSDGNAVDFLVAGHIKYGETPEQALLREMREEMVDQIETYFFVGIVEPLAEEWQVFVYHTYNVKRENGAYVRPQRERGYVVPLENTMYTRMTIPRVILMCVTAGLIDYDANLLHIANLRKRCRSKQKWSILGKEKLSEYFRYHTNSGNPIVALGEEVNDGDFIKCCGPRVDLFKPKEVGLFSGGIKIGSGYHVEGNIYQAKIVGRQSTVRIWCGRKDDELVMPVSRQCAKYLAQYFQWTEQRIFDYLILSEGLINVADLEKMGCKEGVTISSLLDNQRRSSMTIPNKSIKRYREVRSEISNPCHTKIMSGVTNVRGEIESGGELDGSAVNKLYEEDINLPKMKFKNDSKMKNGRKPVKNVIYEKKKGEGGILSRMHNFDI